MLLQQKGGGGGSGGGGGGGSVEAERKALEAKGASKSTGSTVGLGNGSQDFWHFLFVQFFVVTYNNLRWIGSTWTLCNLFRQSLAGVYYKAGEGPPLEEPLSLNEFCICPTNSYKFRIALMPMPTHA